MGEVLEGRVEVKGGLRWNARFFRMARGTQKLQVFKNINMSGTPSLLTLKTGESIELDSKNPKTLRCQGQLWRFMTNGECNMWREAISEDTNDEEKEAKEEGSSEITEDEKKKLIQEEPEKQNLEGEGPEKEPVVESTATDDPPQEQAEGESQPVEPMAPPPPPPTDGPPEEGPQEIKAKPVMMMGMFGGQDAILKEIRARKKKKNMLAEGEEQPQLLTEELIAAPKTGNEQPDTALHMKKPNVITNQKLPDAKPDLPDKSEPAMPTSPPLSPEPKTEDLLQKKPLRTLPHRPISMMSPEGEPPLSPPTTTLDAKLGALESEEPAPAETTAEPSNKTDGALSPRKQLPPTPLQEKGDPAGSEPGEETQRIPMSMSTIQKVPPPMTRIPTTVRKKRDAEMQEKQETADVFADSEKKAEPALSPRGGHLHPLGMDSVPIAERQGYLQKRGLNNKMYKRRWFDLRDNRLRYYKNKGDKKQKGEIKLKKAAMTPDVTTKFGWTIGEEKKSSRKYYILASSQAEMSIWMNSIQMAILSLSGVDIDNLGRDESEEAAVASGSRKDTSVEPESETEAEPPLKSEPESKPEPKDPKSPLSTIIGVDSVVDELKALVPDENGKQPHEASSSMAVPGDEEKPRGWSALVPDEEPPAPPIDDSDSTSNEKTAAVAEKTPTADKRNETEPVVKSQEVLETQPEPEPEPEPEPKPEMQPQPECDTGIPAPVPTKSPVESTFVLLGEPKDTTAPEPKSEPTPAETVTKRPPGAKKLFPMGGVGGGAGPSNELAALLHKRQLKDGTEPTAAKGDKETVRRMNEVKLTSQVLQEQPVETKMEPESTIKAEPEKVSKPAPKAHEESPQQAPASGVPPSKAASLERPGERSSVPSDPAVLQALIAEQQKRIAQLNDLIIKQQQTQLQSGQATGQAGAIPSVQPIISPKSPARGVQAPNQAQVVPKTGPSHVARVMSQAPARAMPTPPTKLNSKTWTKDTVRQMQAQRNVPVAVDEKTRQEMFRMMQYGETFFRHYGGLKGIKKRVLWSDPTVGGKFLFSADQKGAKQREIMSMGEITEIRMGHRTQVFAKSGRPDREKMAFSIMHGTSSWDIEAQDEETKKKWIAAITEIMRMCREQEKEKREAQSQPPALPPKPKAAT